MKEFSTKKSFLRGAYPNVVVFKSGKNEDPDNHIFVYDDTTTTRLIGYFGHHHNHEEGHGYIAENAADERAIKNQDSIWFVFI